MKENNLQFAIKSMGIGAYKDTVLSEKDNLVSEIDTVVSEKYTLVSDLKLLNSNNWS